MGEEKGERVYEVGDTGFKTSDFVHLHNHTHHSLLDGLTKIDELVDEVYNKGMEACAITDHGTLSGVLDFYKRAKAKGIKPIIGYEAYIAARKYTDRDPQYDKVRYHLTVLAMNEKGYKNLMQLSTTANLDGVYYKPRIDHDLLEKYNEGLIILSGCAGGELSEKIKNDDYEGAKEIALWYKSVFSDRYYLEMQDHGHPDTDFHWDVQAKINDNLMKLSKELDIPLVVTCDAHYLDHADQEAHEILLCVGTGSYLSDEKRMSLKEFDLHVSDPKDIITRWSKTCPEAIRNTKRIANRINLEIELGRILIPTFDVPEGYNEHTYLEQMIWHGLAKRYNKDKQDEIDVLTNEECKKLIHKEAIERVEYELSVIDKMGYSGYFLIVQDFINWGKSQGIIFGPGRGSAAGSLIAYAIRITELDPLEYGLLFERFLNPDRISMPDIDVDIQDSRRDEVIAYCTDKYGKERVSNIATFGKMAAKNAVRDVARVLEVPYSEANEMSKTIPPPVMGRHVPLKVSVKEDADLKRLYESSAEKKEVFDYAMRLEGTIRSHGVHACGVVIAPDDLVKYIPLEQAQKGVVATQFPMGEVEELGLLKMDFLGLSNLKIINNALRIIKKVYKTEIDLSSIPLDDKKTYELFQRGDTTGVFQLESAGMKRYLKELVPTNFDDIIAMVALYRPGPMQFIDSFIKRKHSREKITYLHEKMEPALKSTYGILVYQEQFMQISKDLAGFTGGQADTLRKAVGKKKIDLMKKIKPDLIEGAIKHSGADRDMMETFWAQLEEFANYCFNKSHAACYGLIAYWTAYLKANFPNAFMAALMTSDYDDTDRLAIEINECKHMGIDVLAPDVNQSFVEFAVVPEDGSIRFGMAGVKGVGVSAVEAILEARKDGEFKSIEDFARRVPTSKFNRKSWEALIKSGGFDKYGDRADLLASIDTIIAYASKLQKEELSGQADLFGGMANHEDLTIGLDITKAPERVSPREQLLWERELLGLYVSAHPLDNYDTFFNEQTQKISSIDKYADQKTAIIGGIITQLKVINTKSDKKMAFLTLEDKTGEMEVIVFPRTYEEYGGKLVVDSVIKVTGKVDARNRDGEISDEIKVIAREISSISDEQLEEYEPTGVEFASIEKVTDIELRKMKPKISRKPKANKDSEEEGSKTKSKAKAKTKLDLKGTKNAEKLEKVFSNKPKLEYDVLKPMVLFVHLKNPEDHDSLFKIKKACNASPGLDQFVLVMGEEENKTAIRVPIHINPTEKLLNDIACIVGGDCVKLMPAK